MLPKTARCTRYPVLTHFQPTDRAPLGSVCRWWAEAMLMPTRYRTKATRETFSLGVRPPTVRKASRYHTAIMAARLICWEGCANPQYTSFHRKGSRSEMAPADQRKAGTNATAPTSRVPTASTAAVKAPNTTRGSGPWYVRSRYAL